jgi:hypothetical protein
MSLSFDSNRELRLAELQEQLHRARAVTPDLMADVIARARLRSHARHPGVMARILRLVESSAFADATLALLALEPQWKLRRLVYDDGDGTAHSQSSSRFPPSSTRRPKPTTKFCHWRS